jgi:4-diphosphocytidyl-2-C-methyl-D-erythritol kinase
MSDRLGPVVRLAPAKVNLTLAVTGRRPDGFHELHSVMVPLDLADRLSLAPAGGPEDTLHVSGVATGPTADNLVMRAIAATRAAVGRAAGPSANAFPLAARLEKRIPVASGMGGGSSDGAAALGGALEAWSVELPAEVRVEIAAGLGSDVPYFLTDGPALVEGRGERVTPLAGIAGPPPGILVITPDVRARTTDVFAAHDSGGAATPVDPRSTRASSEHLAAELRGGLRAADLVARAGVLAAANDLAAAAFVVVPGLQTLRRSLSRLLARPIGLSGSGPTLWALYPSRQDAATAAEMVRSALAERRILSPGDGPPLVIAASIAGRFKP